MNPPGRRAAIASYALTSPSRAKLERGETKLTPEEYLGQVFEGLLRHSGLEKHDLDAQGLAVSGMVYPHSDIWTSEVAQNLGIRPRWLISSDHGGASGLDLLAQATLAVESGIVDYVTCLGVDAPLSMDVFALDSAGVIRDYENPSGIMGPNSMFAFTMRRHMEQYGTTPEQIGKVSVEQRRNAARNPSAYLRKEITIDEYLNSKMISDPIRLLDCCIPVNQGLGFIVTTEQKANGIGGNKPVYLVGFAEEDGYYHNDIMLPDVTYTGISAASERLFKESRVSVSQMDFAQIYDDYCVAVLMQLEDLGFCEKGKGGDFLEKHSISFDGDVPVNTGGGQLAAGQPGLAGGFVQVVEALIQLRGEGGGRQVKGAKMGCVTGIGGLAYGRNLMLTSLAILSSEDGPSGKRRVRRA